MSTLTGRSRVRGLHCATAAAQADSSASGKKLTKAAQKIAQSPNSRNYLKIRAEVFIAHATGKKLPEERLKSILRGGKNEAEVTLILDDATHLKESGLLAPPPSPRTTSPTPAATSNPD